MTTISEEVRRQLADEAGLALAVEDDGETLTLTGLVGTDIERETAMEIAGEFAPDRRIDDNLEVSSLMPTTVEGLHVSASDQGMFDGAEDDYSAEESLEAGDFSDQHTLASPEYASGPSSSLEDDPVSDGDDVYVPPTDPVAAQTPPGQETEIIGGLQSSSMDSIAVARSALDGKLGDEAIADAIRRELREDAATTDLVMDVTVEQGVVRLRGRVAYLFDAENAQEVAARVPGVVEVLEELDVDQMEING
jgi:osmotically-inducible protein OsmY